MTQRIFDIENKKDMADLWDILPDDVVRIYLEPIEDLELPRCMVDFLDKSKSFFTKYIVINWHDKTEITRPIKEAKESDIGKICAFWDEKCDDVIYGILTDTQFRTFQKDYDSCYNHCRRLTKQEIEELC